MDRPLRPPGTQRSLARETGRTSDLYRRYIEQQASFDTGPGLLDYIRKTDPAAFWPFDEPSGTVAHDATGNGHDLAVGGTHYTWGNPAGPPGTPTIHFPRFYNERAASSGLTLYTIDFAAAVWVNIDGPLHVDAWDLFGQGTPIPFGAAGGWQVIISTGGVPTAVWTDGVTQDAIVANAPLDIGTWYFVGFQRTAAGEEQLWINGLLEADTASTDIAPDGDTWFADDGAGTFSSFPLKGALSYGLLWPRALSGAEWFQLYTRALPLPTDYFLQAPGDGGQAYFGPLHITTYHNGV